MPSASIWTSSLQVSGNAGQANQYVRLVSVVMEDVVWALDSFKSVFLYVNSFHNRLEMQKYTQENSS